MDEASAPAPAAAPVRRRAVRIAAWALGVPLALFAVVLALLLAALVVGTRSERGTAWLLGVLPRIVQVEGARGALLGDFDARRIVLRVPGSATTLTLADAGWRALGVERAASPQWLRISVGSLYARRIDIALGPGRAEPLPPPADLRLPFELEIASLRIGELHLAALGAQPIRMLDARLHLGANAGAEHRIERVAFEWEHLLARADARIASAAPMTLRAAIGIAQSAAGALPAWSASAALTGPLAAPLLQATLRAALTPGRPAQALDARATLRPFAAWPLGELQARTEALDLSAFASAAPATAFTGSASATSTAADQPARVAITLSNALAGRWNDGRLPLRSVTLDLAARPDRPDALTVRAFDADLGSAQLSAGRIGGDGEWSPARWRLAATLMALQPALLDARAPAMQLGGALTLRGAGAGAPIDVQGELSGSLLDDKKTRGPARDVRLRIDAALQADRIELRDAQARAGTAHATLAGLLTRSAADAPWHIAAKAALVDFDPALWWPGRSDSPWRRATHRLNATATLDVRVPRAALGMATLDALGAIRGDAALTLAASVLAGVPVSGSATLRSRDGAPASALVTLVADANRVHAEGRSNPAGNGANDAWDVRIDAPHLDRLAPLFRLFQPPGTDASLAGALSANAHITGRWPALATQGELDASALRVGAFSARGTNARWRIGTAANAPVEAQATLTQLAVMHGGAPGPSVETAQLRVQGTGRAHRVQLRAESKARPPAWAETLQGGTPAAPADARTLAVVETQGGIVDVPGSALAGWRGTLAQLELRSNASGAAPLLRARDIALEGFWGGEGEPRASVQPGRAELLGGAVRWSRLAWQAPQRPGAPAKFDVDAQIEPLRIAPLLAQLQPAFGWGGDLRVGGRIALHSGASFNADVVIERSAGDLTVTDELGTRALGLTDLRLGLAAADGVWNFTQGLAGANVGVAAGAVVVRTAPEATWPQAGAPIQGVLELRVADLGSWGTWVPPGWRIGGALHSSASIGGRFGAPEYTGNVEGTGLSVRNFLQGVNVRDGDVAIRLQGRSARIERFTAKGGDGSVKLEGSAELGEVPKAVLQVTAQRFQVLGRVDRRIVASGAGELRLDSKALAFDGKFDVDEGLIDFTRGDAPTLSDDVTVRRASGAASPAAAASAAAAAAAPSATPTLAPQPLGRAVALDLRVTLGEKLRVRGRGLDTGLRGELHITSPGGRLAVNGTVRAADGTYAAYGQKLAIDRGLITFNGAIENPRLDIEATRPNTDVRVGVAVSGSAANPRVRLFSEPELAELDKLSWLVMGRASEGLGRTDTALLQRAALALLAGEGGGPTEQITKALGLDEISVRQTETGEVRNTVIGLGKQLSQRWYVGYERGLNATTGSFQLIYRIAQRFTLRAQSGEDNSLDVIWTWRWN